MSEPVKPNHVGRAAELYQDQPLLRALTQILPGGGALAELLDFRARQLSQARLRMLLKQLADGDVVLTEDMLYKDDTIHAIVVVSQAAIRARDERKIHVFARLLTATPPA